MMTREELCEICRDLEKAGHAFTVTLLLKHDREQREALARVEAELAEALGEIRIYQQKFRYIAEGGSFYLATAAECVRLTSSFLAMHANTPEAQAEQQETQGVQAGEFQREDRYIVIKRKDLEAIERSGEASDLETHEAVRLLAEALDTLRPHLPARECLVIESDWPEYEPAWAAIQARMTGQGAQAGEFWTWLDFAYRDGSKGEGRNFTKYNMEVAYHAGILHARAALATQPAEWVDPVALHPVENLYNQGFADGVAEAKRLNTVRGAEQ